MLIIKVAIKKNILRRKIKIKKETREGTKRNYFTQRKIAPHQKSMMTMEMIKKEYSSW